MMNTNLDLQHVVSNSDGFYNFPEGENDTLTRDGGVDIEYYKDSHTFGLFPQPALFPLTKSWKTKVQLSEQEVFRIAEECREQWRKNTVEYQEGGSYPFQTVIDFSDRPDFIRRVGRQLAIAGDKLFFNLFEREKNNQRLREIAHQLRNKSFEREMVLTITSETFFIPWGMIYTHPHRKEKLKPDGSNFEWDGFWGFRHIIEHNPESYGRYNVLERDEKQLVRASMNMDELIDVDFGIKSVAKQKQFFAQLVEDKILQYQERCSKRELQLALEADDFSDRILYFYCHARAANLNEDPALKIANIKLTDQEPINDGDIALWLRDQTELKTHPLVFINACKGGQMTTMFFKTFAVEFLKQRARGLIGAQIDIPAEFGAEYAQRLFSEFLKSSQPPELKIRLGPLMRQLTREFIDQYKNPLGLIYSLYRGLDVYVDRRPDVLETF
jgi:hypothetical protein